MTKKEAEKEVIKHPEMIEHCKKVFYQIACPDCKFRTLCKSLDWYSAEYKKTYPIFPLGFVGEIK